MSKHYFSQASSDEIQCHPETQQLPKKLPRITIVGSPNVGKSVLFNQLTGIYVSVSNYPGTTVEVAQGKGKVNGSEVEVVDTPGMYRLRPITEEERVARNLLMQECPDMVVHVVDAKNLHRMLSMTLQLINADLPVVLVVNMMDEADRLGIKIDAEQLEAQLGIPVILTALSIKRGHKTLVKRMADYLESHSKIQAIPSSKIEISYPKTIQEASAQIQFQLKANYAFSRETMAYLLLQNDPDVWKAIKSKEPQKVNELKELVESIRARLRHSVAYEIARSDRDYAEKIARQVISDPQKNAAGFSERLSQLMINPLTGIPILLFSLLLFYLLVGVFGAQVLVDFIENTIFGKYLNPAVNRLLQNTIPWESIRNLLGGEYGILTLGMRYAIAIILPIVGTFFLAFSFIEDSGYLPRLALLIDRAFKKIGLNGRAVIPIVLGFGCDTMATIVTRTLETKRERIIATLLLGLAIPCSAQLGVLMGMLAGHATILIIWVLIVAAVFLLVGYLSAQLLPGTRPNFYIELPPLRLPTIKNIMVKTYTRMEWYIREVIPLFILASVFIWFGQLTGLFGLILDVLKPMVRLIRLPEETAIAFLFGFFRRDYGAAGLYDLRHILSGNQLLVAVTTMTLFIPCIAQFAVTIKERGLKTALLMFAFILIFAFLIGWLLANLLVILGVQL